MMDRFFSLSRALDGRRFLSAGLVLALLGVGGGAWGQDRVVYRCPGSVYTDQLSAKEAQRQGCRTLDGTPISVIQVSKPTRVPPSSKSDSSPSVRPAAGGESGAAALRVDAKEQRARDTDARRILETELRREEEKLAALRKEFANGEPERRGDERNFAKYQERVSEMKAAIQRKEADILALRRELSKLGAP